MPNLTPAAAAERKAKVYATLGLRLVYQPGKQKVLVTNSRDQDPLGDRFVSEGRLEPFAYLLTSQLAPWLDLP
ncbi:hypothetical protein [Sphaerisporangium rhizosphaerae]|uniref:Uncharacterized protein n=1 Tax=Sphaerisporangium rhizosphaerae TaxID=2269375 RepID=A0ABW2NXN2_9ACTN